MRDTGRWLHVAAYLSDTLTLLHLVVVAVVVVMVVVVMMVVVVVT